MPAIATLEFEIKHGVVDTDGLNASVLSALNASVALYKRRKYTAGASLLLPFMYFDWSWSECEGNASEVIEDPQDLHIRCTPANCFLRAGDSGIHPVLRVGAKFKVRVRDGVGEEDFKRWLDTHAAWVCGTIGGGWGYLDSVTNLYVTGFRSLSPRKRRSKSTSS